MSDFLIIGGGIIGLLTARALQKRGARVTLIEAGKVGQEASWAGGGIISPLYPWRYSDFITSLAKASQTSYPSLAAELLDETGIDIELIVSGMLMIASHDQIPAKAWALLHQQIVVELPKAEVALLQPGLGIVDSALWMPQIMQLRNPRLLQALAASLKRTGVEIIEHQRVQTFGEDNNRITHIVTAQRTFKADKVIIAAGAWSGGLLSTLGLDIPIEPVKGQMLLFKAEKNLLSKMVLYRNHYLIPRRDGHILAGSTLEYQSGFNQLPSEAAYNELYQSAITLLPTLKNHPVWALWAGLRPLAPDNAPIIGRVEPYSNLFINAGHFRNGLVLAPGAAQFLLEGQGW